MKIIADDQIPLIDELFDSHHLVKKPGALIENKDLQDAGMLWVRTLTPVTEELLRHSPVKFVGAATAGYDHLDIQSLVRRGIAWAYAPGANAKAVAEYVLCVIAALRQRNLLLPGKLKAGVIGAGYVGSLVAQYLAKIGFQVILNDPPRAAREPGFLSQPLAELVDLDLLCLHPALTREGEHPSFHLLGEDFFKRQKPGMVFLNAARGEIVDTQVLLKQRHIHLCLDVWENEPEINLELLNRVLIATPHIAAYSTAAKCRASLLLYQQAKQFFNLPCQDKLADSPSQPISWLDWEGAALDLFDVYQYAQKMREILTVDNNRVGEKFSQLRKNYIFRKELNFSTSS